MRWLNKTTLIIAVVGGGRTFARTLAIPLLMAATFAGEQFQIPLTVSTTIPCTRRKASKALRKITIAASVNPAERREQTETMSNDNAKQFRARLRKEAQAINERNRVPGDLYYKESAPPPEQPAPEVDGEWFYNYTDIHSGARDRYHIRYEGNGDCIAHASTERAAKTIVTDHRLAALVPGFVAILNGLGWHSQNGVDSCWCHVKSEPYADHTKQCEQIQALIAAARKAGVE